MKIVKAMVIILVGIVKDLWMEIERENTKFPSFGLFQLIAVYRKCMFILKKREFSLSI
jgi:hypothetical protein